MNATEHKGAAKQPAKRMPSTAGQVAEMESEGQGQSTSVPPPPDGGRGRKRVRKGVQRAQNAAPVESVEEGAAADQDIDTAGTELDEER